MLRVSLLFLVACDIVPPCCWRYCTGRGQSLQIFFNPLFFPFLFSYMQNCAGGSQSLQMSFSFFFSTVLYLSAIHYRE
jgi:hypothetical protein